MKLSLLALVIFLLSCNKDHSCIGCSPENVFQNATITDNGPVAADGCGWLVKIGDNQFYHPDKLSEKYREHNLNVKICYKLTSDKFYCGLAATPIPVIHVLKIRK